jgi:hypothetical protein
MTLGDVKWKVQLLEKFYKGIGDFFHFAMEQSTC